jgi:periplasmic protein CpxP/Spy
MRQHPPARHRARNHMRHRTKDRYQCLYKVRSGGNIPMKRFLSFLVQVGVLAAGLVCGAQLFAQEPGSVPETSAPPPVQGPGGGRRGMMDPDQQLARMSKRYNLSADQQSQIKPILVSQEQQRAALRGDSSLSPEDRKAKMQSIRSDSDTKIEAVLKDDQKKKFEQDRMQGPRQQRGQGGGPGGGGPPPEQ